MDPPTWWSTNDLLVGGAVVWKMGVKLMELGGVWSGGWWSPLSNWWRLVESEVEVGGVCWEVGGVHCQIGGVCRRLVESTVKSVEFIFSLVESAHPNRLPQAPPTSKQTPPTATSDCTNLHQRPNRLPLDPPNRLHQLHLRLHQLHLRLHQAPPICINWGSLP